MIVFIFHALTYFILNYVDHFVSTDYEDRIVQAHETFVQLLRDIVMNRSLKKSVPPMQTIEFIGNLFDAVNFKIDITDIRKSEVMCELKEWKFKITTTRKQLERLIGKL